MSYSQIFVVIFNSQVVNFILVHVSENEYFFNEHIEHAFIYFYVLHTLRLMSTMRMRIGSRNVNSP